MERESNQFYWWLVVGAIVFWAALPSASAFTLRVDKGPEDGSYDINCVVTDYRIENNEAKFHNCSYQSTGGDDHPKFNALNYSSHVTTINGSAITIDLEYVVESPYTLGFDGFDAHNYGTVTPSSDLQSITYNPSGANVDIPEGSTVTVSFDLLLSETDSGNNPATTTVQITLGPDANTPPPTGACVTGSTYTPSDGTAKTVSCEGTLVSVVNTFIAKGTVESWLLPAGGKITYTQGYTKYAAVSTIPGDAHGDAWAGDQQQQNGCRTSGIEGSITLAGTPSTGKCYIDLNNTYYFNIYSTSENPNDLYNIAY